MDNRLDQGQVQNLVPRRKNEWLRWIGPIDLDSQGSHWLPVDVDPSSGVLVGLPGTWRERLKPLIMAEAADFMRSHSGEAPEGQPYYRDQSGIRQRAPDAGDSDLPKRPPEWTRTRIEADDFLVGSSEHSRYLARVFSSAKSMIAVTSAFLSVASLDSTMESIREALSRGVDVDLLWGYSSDSAARDKQALDRLKKLAYDAKQGGLIGKLRFNTGPSGSHSKVLMFDLAVGEVEGSIGSYNWLSAISAHDREREPLEVTMRLREPEIVAQLARCIAGFWRDLEADRLGGTSDRWMRVASELEQSALETSGKTMREINAQVRLILDREHEALLREWTSTTQGALLLTSHRLGVAAEGRLVTIGKSQGAAEFERIVAYGETELNVDAVTRIARNLEEFGAKLVKNASLHAKVLISDRSSCVTSYNFLSADPFGNSARSRELGVAFEGPMVESLRERISALLM